MFEKQSAFGDMEDEGFGLEETGDGLDFLSDESEYEDEGFGELEDFGDMMGADTLGATGEGYADGFGVDGYVDGFGGFDGEADNDEFLGSVWKAAKGAAKKLAPLAKKFAPAIGTVIGSAIAGPAGAALGGKLGSVVKSLESEDEGETEDEMNAPVRVPPIDDGLSEAMAVAASKSRPADAQSLGSALTVTIASRAPLSVKAVLPVLAKASGDVARNLAASSDPRAKALIRTLPSIQKKTIATLTRKAQTGKPVTPRTAVRVMARHASRVMGNPQAIATALANNAVKKRGIDRKAVAAAERFH